ncbi:MAG TPA: glycosyltransferase, partial [Aggregatilineales bacterium]|nr:glycosyltransferase [Aggregatilineales bacterium]
MKIALNAHLLSAQTGYRSAGIHGYIYHTLRCLPDAAQDAEFDVLTGAGNPPEHPRMHIHRSRFSTANPIRRIIWEQVIQRSVLRKLAPDLYHGMAFVAPMGLHIPSVVTVYDLSFIRYPAGLSTARRLYLKLFTRQSCNQAARVIAISQSTARDLVTLFNVPESKIDVALPGVMDVFKPLDAESVARFR